MIWYLEEGPEQDLCPTRVRYARTSRTCLFHGARRLKNATM